MISRVRANFYSIKKIGLCAGSGGSMFKNLNVDLLFTGELSHHEALAAKERGISVITCECARDC